MSAPLVINLRDGSVWERRAMTAAGVALYALAGSCRCPEYLMASESELAAQGIAGTADVLPVPAGPEPQGPRPIAYAAKNTDLLLADAAERSRAAEWPWDMWCRICHIRPTSHRTEAEALEAADRHVKLEHASQAEVHKLMAAGGLSELERLRAQVTELQMLLPSEPMPLVMLAEGVQVRAAWSVWEQVAGVLGVELPSRPRVDESAGKLSALLAPSEGGTSC